MDSPEEKTSITDKAIHNYYRKFESLIALILTFIIVVIVIVAISRLGYSVYNMLLVGMQDPLDHKVFQTIFGEIITLLIALEFSHTLQYVVTRQQSIIQTKVVVLIAILALSRKFIILDLDKVNAGELLGLSTATLALGLTYLILKLKNSN
ncbi:phosphate-starvation-inducible PsiE family protein [Microbulbifer sp. EKSA008]|uniref:phosphate-starvation-inducible PsiE family protein n=1 Tax=unclassified Microbulbifer TaxID=2619833 RepID=UPI0024ADE4B7|nr:phosphate-starvation-inducible PsiE family protein [Microbulbifer sp. VAAF005]WHI45193.1 phosphate-starvation-inducible PsiE family protein [Microbulbifer sp. VAAF005]WNZ56089.1 phosphate-starvation-inducible PsiE family protein [Microbulbifer sp. MKSA007]